MTATQPTTLRDRTDDPVALSPESFARFARFITSELGIKMPESKVTLVQSRLLRRVRELQMKSIEQYGEYFFASSSAEERQQLIDAITTNKTDFFREAEHFDYLRRIVLPARGDGRGRRFQAWCAGCSSGEEPYTLAMVLANYAGGVPGFDFAILGTDVSTRVLTRARNGIYAEALADPIPPEFRRKYLMRSRGGPERLVRVVPGLRSRISFHQLNFMDEDYSIGDVFEVVFFRNVMIYFDRSTQEAVINKICRNLVPGGYLFAGHSESLAQLDVPLKAVGPAVYRKHHL